MLDPEHHTPLVLVSILVAVLASYTALTLMGRVTQSQGTAERWWIAGGALAMGTGIWAMHFIGMLAFRLPIPLGYDLSITVLSWVLPVIVSALGLWQVSRPRLTVVQLGIGSILFGIGINSMHYVGMAALRIEPGIVYDTRLVVASLAIAISASAASLWIALKLRNNQPHLISRRIVAALFMGAAIVGMHYTGMAAAGFPVGCTSLAASQNFTLDGLAIMVVIATVSILSLAMLISVFDSRLEARSALIAFSENTAAERQQLLERERAARAEAERLGLLKDQFLATLSHELRTPLNAILGWAQLLQRKSLTEGRQRDGLQTIERNARAQARLIEDLLDMSRIVSGKVELEMEWLEPRALVEAAVDSARPSSIAKGIALEVRIDTIRGAVQGDNGRLQQVMGNIISNAIKFTPEGGVVQVTAECQEDELVVNVSDTGIGIEADFLPHVFDRFRQFDASTKRRYGGLGLGLSISRQLVELHRGRIDATSAGRDRGATFTLHLPLVREPLSDRHDELQAPEAAGFAPVDLKDRKVLVVDDEPDARRVVQQLLDACGAEVRLADSAREALRLLGEERPDVLVSDIGMPEVDGFELIEQVRSLADHALAGVPAMALSAFTSREDQRRARQVGFDSHLSKPVDAALFVREVARLSSLQPRATR